MADLTAIVLPTDLMAQGASAADARRLQSYLYQLTEQLRYVLSNLDSENMSASFNAGLGGAAVQVAALTRAEQEDIDALRKSIVTTASRIAHDYESAITQADDALKAQVDEAYTAYSDSQRAALESLLSSRLTQTSRALEVSLASVTALTQQTSAALETLRSDSDTWFRFTADGLEIGKSQDGTAMPYTLRIDNRKLAFLRYGAEVASLQYDRLYVTAAEVADRLSIGGSAGEGYYDFITTAAGLGIKWRAN